MDTSNPFKWRHFQAEIILLCIRWYLRYSLSYRDLEEMMLERGLNVDHTTIFGPVTDLRGWESVDVNIQGRFFRFVTTHLETYSASVQVAQGNELLQGPGNTSLPVVFAGDFNSAAGSGGPDQTPTYGNLIAAGLVDSWNVAHPGVPGYTWPLHGEDPSTSSSTPTERIDLVLYRGGFGTLGAQRIGNTTADLTPSGLWPSDHAGVVTTLQLPK